MVQNRSVRWRALFPPTFGFSFALELSSGGCQRWRSIAPATHKLAWRKGRAGKIGATFSVPPDLNLDHVCETRACYHPVVCIPLWEVLFSNVSVLACARRLQRRNSVWQCENGLPPDGRAQSPPAPLLYTLPTNRNKPLGWFGAIAAELCEKSQ